MTGSLIPGRGTADRERAAGWAHDPWASIVTGDARVRLPCGLTMERRVPWRPVDPKRCGRSEAAGP